MNAGEKAVELATPDQKVDLVDINLGDLIGVSALATHSSCARPSIALIESCDTRGNSSRSTPPL